MVCWPGEPNSIPPLSSSGSSRSFGFHPEEGGWDLSSLPVSVFFFFFFSSFCVAFFYSKRKRKTVTPSFELGSHNYSKAITNARPPGNPHSNKKKHTHTAELGLTVYWRGGKRSVVIGFIIIHFDLTLCPNEGLEAQPRNLLCASANRNNKKIAWSANFRLFRPTKAKRLVKKKGPKHLPCVYLRASIQIT